MRLGERIRSRAKDLGVNHSELARRAGVAQSTVSTIINGDARWSPHLLKIARALATTPAYLTGETDDPEEGAPPPPTQPRLQLITMPVALPTEDALADGFEAVLSVSADMTQAELARELARSLPAMLRLAAGAVAVQPLVAQSASDEEPADPPRADRERRRA